MKYDKPDILRDRVDLYYEQLINDMTSMLEYDNVPDGLNTAFMERYKIEGGGCGVGMIDGKLTAFRCDTPAGPPDAYGIGTRLVGATPIGSFDGEIGTEGVYCKNNSLMISDNEDIAWYAQMLSDIDISFWYNVIYTRFNNVFTAANENIKKAITKAFENQSVGTPMTILTDMNFSASLEGVKPVDVLPLTDIRDVDKLQYLTRAKDDLMRTFYTRRGISMMNSTKAAQQTVNETQENDALAMIYPINRLEEAKKSVDEINALFGTDIKVHFNPIWELAYMKYIATVEGVCVDPETEEIEQAKEDEVNDNNEEDLREDEDIEQTND